VQHDSLRRRETHLGPGDAQPSAAHLVLGVPHLDGHVIIELEASPLCDPRAKRDAEVGSMLIPEPPKRFDVFVKERKTKSFGSPLSSTPSGS
jgi:hypothetical protein